VIGPVPTNAKQASADCERKLDRDRHEIRKHTPAVEIDDYPNQDDEPKDRQYDPGGSLHSFLSTGAVLPTCLSLSRIPASRRLSE